MTVILYLCTLCNRVHFMNNIMYMSRSTSHSSDIGCLLSRVIVETLILKCNLIKRNELHVSPYPKWVFRCVKRMLSETEKPMSIGLFVTKLWLVNILTKQNNTKGISYNNLVYLFPTSDSFCLIRSHNLVCEHLLVNVKSSMESGSFKLP